MPVRANVIDKEQYEHDRPKYTKVASALTFGVLMGMETFLVDMSNGYIFSAPIDAMVKAAFYLVIAYKLQNNSLYLGAAQAVLNIPSFNIYSMFGRGITAMGWSAVANIAGEKLITATEKALKLR